MKGIHTLTISRVEAHIGCATERNVSNDSSYFFSHIANKAGAGEVGTIVPGGREHVI